MRFILFSLLSLSSSLALAVPVPNELPEPGALGLLAAAGAAIYLARRITRK